MGVRWHLDALMESLLSLNAILMSPRETLVEPIERHEARARCQMTLAG
jgi:hypothetical protein